MFSIKKNYFQQMGNGFKRYLARKSHAVLGGLSETQLVIIVSIIVLGVAGISFYSATSSTKVAHFQNDVIVLRSSINQTFTRDYGELSNMVAINSGVVPKGFIKGSSIVNNWGGDITLTPLTDNSGFTILVADIPKDVCPQLGGFQVETWINVKVNSVDVSSGSVATLSTACNNTFNSITYTAR